MQQRVPSHLERRPRGVALVPAAAFLALLFPAASFAQNPTVDSLVVVPTLFEAAVSANVVSVGGSPLTSRGFVYSRTADNLAPVFGGSPGVNTLSQGGQTGTFSATITNLIPRVEYAVRAYAQNGEGAGHSPVEIFTAPCPVRIFPDLPGASVGTSYGFFLQALGGFGSDGYSVIAGPLPPGMGLDYWGGYLYGTPTVAGIYNFTVEVYDWNFGCAGSRAYSLEVEALHVVPRKLAFASELVGVTSPTPKVLTIVNNGVTPVNLSLPFAPVAAPFAILSTDCLNPLPPFGGSCQVQLTYTPPSATVHNGTMAIGHDQVGGPLVVPLRGAGTISAVQQVYSSNEDSDTVTVIDPVNNAVRDVVGVGDGPGGIAVLPGGAKVYVPNRWSNSVSVITTTPTHTVTATIVDANFNYPIAAAATRGGDAVWVVSRDSDAITIIGTGTDSVLGTIYHPCVDSPRGVVANPVNHEMYVMSDATGSICVFDRVSRTFLRDIYVGGYPESAVVLPNGTALYMITGNNQRAVRVDLPSGSITTISGVYGHSLDMTADGSRVYVGREGDGLAVIDTSDNSVTSIPLTGNPAAYGVAVHDAAGRVFVSDTNRIFVLDLASNTELPSADLPILDSSFQGARVLATAKNPVLAGVVPTVGNLANGAPGFVATPVSADVTADGGAPIFERGFAYSTTDTTPEPNEPDVLALPVPGMVSSMNGVLTGLTSGVTYYYQAYAKNIWGTGVSGAGSFLNQTCPAVIINEANVPNGLQGAAYSAPFTVSGTATGPFTFTFLNLPSGLSGTGSAISGTPTEGFLGDIQVRATDVPTGCFVENTYTLMIGSTPAPRDLVISEFRTRGVSGALDEYVELGNRTNSMIVVASQDGSGGWSVGSADGTVAVIPDGTVIEKGGHWLATGPSFSLWDYGAPGPLCQSWDFGADPPICLSGADASLLTDLADDFGLALFKTADSGNYNAGTRLDSVGGSLETDPLYFEGAKLAELGATDPLYQTAWVRRLTNMAILSDVDDNDRDFLFVATDAGSYGPTSAVDAVLGGPNPEDTRTVRDVLNAEFPASLIDPARGPQQSPNRQVEGYSNRIEYRRAFTNNTGKDIGMLAFKVINLTTRNSRQTLANQGDLRVIDADDDDVFVDSLGEWVETTGARLDYRGMYPLTEGWNGDTTGGVNSRLIVPFGLSIPQGLAPVKGAGAKGPGACNVFADGESLPVNFRLTYESGGGYYIFVLVPQISHDILDPPVSELGKGAANLCQGGGGPRVR